MIEKIQIKNYRSCHETTLELQPDLSVLIGPNGSGKTTILKACLLILELLNDRRSRHLGYREYEKEPATDECQLKIWFRQDTRRVILNADIQLYTQEDNSDVILSSDQSWYAKDYTGNRRRIKMPLGFVIDLSSSRGEYIIHPRYPSTFRFGKHKLEIPEEFKEPLSLICSYISQIKYYSASQFTNPASCPVSIEVEKTGFSNRSSRALRAKRGHTGFIYDLYRAHKTPKLRGYEEFLGVIGQNGIGLVDGIDFKEIQTSSVEHRVRSGGQVKTLEREKLLVVPQFILGKNILSPSQLSEGTFKTITLLFYVMTEKSSLLLIEEPEVCVHHGLLSSIVELIKTYSKKKQIVVSTHSDFILDQIKPENVYSVARNPKDGTKVKGITQSMSSQDLAALKEYLNTEGSLGEYWRHGGLE